MRAKEIFRHRRELGFAARTACGRSTAAWTLGVAGGRLIFLDVGSALRAGLNGVVRESSCCQGRTRAGLRSGALGVRGMSVWARGLALAPRSNASRLQRGKKKRHCVKRNRTRDGTAAACISPWLKQGRRKQETSHHRLVVDHGPGESGGSNAGAAEL